MFDMEVIYLIGKKLFAKKVLLKNSLQTTTTKKTPLNQLIFLQIY